MPDGVQSLPDGVRSSPDGVQSLPDGVRPVPDGVQSLPDGVRSSPDGVQSLPDDVRLPPDGAQSLPDGVRPVPDGVQSLPDGVRSLPDGVQPPPDGVQSLPDGVQLSPDGVRRHLIVDAANVVGSRPDGWWRDRAGAAARLAAQVTAALDAGRLDTDVVHLVLEGAAKAAVVPDHPRMHVVRAPADGDGAIVELAGELGAAPGGIVTVVTADRGLRARLTAPAIGPSTLLGRL